MRRKVESKKHYNINGVKQFINISGNNINNPVILFVHGGPGISCDPVFSYYQKALTDDYIVAKWHQRGAGKSSKNLCESSVNLDTYVNDAKEVIKLLLEKFNKKNLTIIAHSWGTVIGMELVKRYPMYINHYFSISQIVNMKSSLLWSVSNFNQSSKSVKNILDINFDDLKRRNFNDFVKINRYIVRKKGSIHNCRSYSRYAFCYFLPSQISIMEGITSFINYRQTSKVIWKELIATNYININKLSVPITFINGRKDLLTSSDIVYDFYLKLKSDKQFVWFENSAHCPQWEEAKKFNKLIKDTLKKNQM